MSNADHNNTPKPVAPEKSQVRATLRECRRQISEKDQRLAAESLKQIFSDQQFHITRDHIGLYFPNDGEINPLPLAHWLEQQGKNCYLPIVDPTGDTCLEFGHFSPSKQDILINNRFGIPEPVSSERVPVGQLGMLLLPLVGFDSTGNRIGMGKGFYDRTLATIPLDENSLVIVGLAHECQQVDHIEPDSWDIPLDGIITDQRFYPCR